MNKSRSTATNAADEDAALVELTSVLPAGDRLRFAALGRVSLLNAAKQKSLLRQEKALVARVGPDAPEVKNTRLRLEHEKRFAIAITVETQRTQATTTTRNPEALTLHGRVVNPQRLAVPGLTVSATDHNGKSAAHTATDANGYYSLAVPATAGNTAGTVSLLVSDRKKAVHYRGTECFAREPGRIHYRELVTGTTDPTPPPTPPPDVDPKAVTVPEVVGLRDDVAAAQLRAVGLAVASSTRESSAENAGRVIAQDPKAGTKVPPASSVAIVVGATPPTLDLPNVVGLTVEAAKSALEKLQLKLGTITPAGATSQARIAQQTPAAGTAVAPGHSVDVVVRDPVTTVEVPNVVESRVPAARKAIDAAGLVIGKVDPPESSSAAVVAAQAPAAAAKVPAGTPVNLVVRDPASNVSVPNLLRHDLTAAQLALQKAGLKTGKIDPTNVPENSAVIRQSPEAGASVKPGTAVDLFLRAAGKESLLTTKVAKPTKATKATVRKKPRAK